MSSRRFQEGAGIVFLFLLVALPVIAQESVSRGELTGSLFSVVAPLSGDRAYGSVVFLARPLVDGVDVRVRLVSSDGGWSSRLSPDDSFSASWDSSLVEDGDYTFEFEGCLSTRCDRSEVVVHVANRVVSDGLTRVRSSRSPRVVGSGEGALVSVYPSNYSGRFQLSGESLAPLSSSGDPWVVAPGRYEADLSFTGISPLTLSLSGVRLVSSGTLATVSSPRLQRISVGDEEWVVSDSYAVDVSSVYGDGQLSVVPAPGRVVAFCPSWVGTGRFCSSGWTFFRKDFTRFSYSSSLAFAFVHPEGKVVPSRPLPVPVVPTFLVSLPSEWMEAVAYSSSGEEVRRFRGSSDLPAGVYGFDVHVLGSSVSSVHLENVRVDRNGVLVALDEGTGDLSVSDALSFREQVVVHSDYSFSSGQVSFTSAWQGRSYFSCGDWDWNRGSCLSSFVATPPLVSVDRRGGVRLSLVSRSQAFRLGGLTGLPSVVPLSDGFSANDSPTVEVHWPSDDGSSIPIGVVLSVPDGRSLVVDESRITRVSPGVFSVTIDRPNPFVPGEYSLSVHPRVVGFASSAGFQSSGDVNTSFSWGLVAVNTMRSIYRPGDTAEFEIVVLGPDSIGVVGADVVMGVDVPSQGRVLLSTSGGSIQETTNPGIYVARLPVSVKGEYVLHVDAVAPSVDSSIRTSFWVDDNYAYDILRWTQTKIDPAHPPVDVALNITPFASSDFRVMVREFVPLDFNIQIGSFVERPDSNGGFVSVFVPDESVRIYDANGLQVIEWPSVVLDPVSGVRLQYQYFVPDKKPWLYFLGPIQVIPLDGNVLRSTPFMEARSWMVAVDANPTSKLFFRRTSFRSVSEPAPNDANCGTGCNIASYLAGVQLVYGLSDINGVTSDTNAGATGTTVGIKKYFSGASYPLVPQTITTSGTWMAGIKCALSSVTDNNSAAAFTIYRWKAQTDSNGERIVERFNTAACPATAAMRQGTRAGNVASVTFERNDRLIVEVLAAVNSTAPPPTSRTLTYTFGNTGSSNDGNVILPAGVTLRFVGDANTEVIAPNNDTAVAINTPFDVNARASCANHTDNASSYFDCGDVNVNLRYCVLTNGVCGAFSDMNTVSTSLLYVSSGPAVENDNVLNMTDTNVFTFTVTGTRTGTYTLRSEVDGNWLYDINYSSGANDRNITIYSPPDVNVIKFDGYLDDGDFPVFDYYGNTTDGNILIDFNVMDADTNGLLVDLNYSSSSSPNTGTAIVDDLNLSTLASSGDWYCTDTNFLNPTTCGVDWNILGVADGNYWIHVTVTDSLGVDQNTSDRNVGVHNAPPTDYTFVLFLPSSGCTVGKGNITGGTSCQKGYIETTDTSGVADENKVNPEGQSSTTPFFVYDNQSSTSSDFNIFLDLNASLSATLKIKVSKIYDGWASTCTGNTDTNCVLLTTSQQSVGKATYSAGSQDLNIFLWGDFVGVGVGDVDINVDSNAGSST